ncbi:MAG: hypothetical protein K940chlam7_01956 [Chlamydiae bacterium]|nr:hypothetical protein [Chlamydiota bacterium]
MGLFPLIFHSSNFLLSIWMVKMGFVPTNVVAAFSVPLAEGVVSIIHPPIRTTPRQLGMRQLGVNSLFILLMVL